MSMEEGLLIAKKSPRVAQMAPMLMSTQPKKILIHIEVDSGQRISFKIYENVACKKLYRALAAHLSMHRRNIRCVTQHGERLHYDELLDVYDVEDGDVIDCHLERLGGGNTSILGPSGHVYKEN